MAYHRAPKVSGRATALGIVGVTAGTVALLPAASQAAPTQSIDQVKAEVNSLNQQAEVAGQAFDAAQEQYTKLQQKIDGLQSQITQEQSALTTLETSMGLQAAAAYRSGGISPTLQLAIQSSPDKYLAEAGMIDQETQQEAMQLKSIAQAKAQLAEDKKNASDALAQQQAAVTQAAANKTKLQTLLQQEQGILNTLTAQQRAQVTSTTSGGASSTGYSGSLPAVSGRAGAAVAYVKAHVGYSYVYGDTGPSAFDCSGLMYAAWAAAGVKIPRTSEEQAAAYENLSSASQLQPGDFIFFYGSSPSHVGMYVGDGMFIDARNESVGVVWGSLDPSSKYYSYMPVSGYGRVTG
jgi:cell wall-associated NlpC family hydrolase